MIRQAAFWSFFSQIASFVIQFGSSVIVARLLSPKELGVYAVAMAIIGIVQLFAALGVSTYVVREENLTVETMDSAFTINALISVLLSLVIFASSFLNSFMFDDASVAGVLRLLALSPLLNIPGFLPAVMLTRAMELRGASIMGILSAFVTASVTIGTALAGASSMSPAYGGVAGAAVAMVGTTIIGRRHLRIRFSLQRWRPILGFGLQLMSIGGISSAATRVADIVLGHFLGLAALGLYARASNLSNILFTNVYGAASRVIFAKLSEARREGDRVTEVYLHGFRVITAVMAPLLLGLAVLSRPAIAFLYGERWIGAAWPLSLLLLGQLISLTFAMNWELFVLRDELKTQTKLELIRSTLGVVSQAAGSMVSIVAVAASGITTNLISFFMYQRHMARLARTPSRTFLHAYREAGLLAFVAAAPALALMVFRGWSPQTPLVEVFGSVALGILLWLMMIVRTGHPALREINVALGKLTDNRVRLGQPM